MEKRGGIYKYYVERGEVAIQRHSEPTTSTQIPLPIGKDSKGESSSLMSWNKKIILYSCNPYL
jgi:hypothetical protein